MNSKAITIDESEALSRHIRLFHIAFHLQSSHMRTMQLSQIFKKSWGKSLIMTLVCDFVLGHIYNCLGHLRRLRWKTPDILHPLFYIPGIWLFTVPCPGFSVKCLIAPNTHYQAKSDLQHLVLTCLRHSLHVSLLKWLIMKHLKIPNVDRYMTCVLTQSQACSL